MSTWTYRADQEEPAYAVSWYSADGDLIDFTDSSFEVKLVNRDTGIVALTKPLGITGAASAPNVVVGWATGELDIEPGVYAVHLTATKEGLDRMFKPGNEPHIKILAAV